MKTYILLGAAGLISIIAACKKKVAAPEANFSLSKTEVKEGESFTLNNSSKNAVSYTWTGTNNNFTSTATSPDLFIDSAGDYSFTLTAKNSEGATSTKSLTLKVLPDTAFRIRGITQKKWIIESLIYNGSETQAAACQKDDEFVFYHTGNDTFQITEGVSKCPSGTYIFEIPASGSWIYRSSKNTLNFSLIALGNPFSFDFKLTTITPSRLIGTDAVNNVTIKMWRK